MKAYISADIEGIAGVVSKDQLIPGGFEYAQAREWMTQETLAAAEAAHQAGAEEVVISDGHGNAQNLVLDKMPSYVRLVRSWPRALVQMEGIELDTFDAALMVGHHTSKLSRDGVISHSFHGACIRDVRLNGESQSETSLNALLAAHFGVPTIFCSGDSDYIKHVNEFMPQAETVVTKHACGYSAMQSPSVEVTSAWISEGVALAFNRLDEIKAPKLPTTYELVIEFQGRSQAELLEYLPWVNRSAPYSIRCEFESIVGRHALYLIRHLLSANRRSRVLGMTTFINCRVFDGKSDQLREGLSIRVDEDRITEIREGAVNTDADDTIDCGGRTLMPGLIDAHVHAYATHVNLNKSDNEPPTLVAHHARRMLENMLQRGFTAARDTGGADYGLAMALRRKWINGPRLFYCEKAISQTGGHGDFRDPEHHSHDDSNCLSCGCAYAGHLSIAADGVPAVRKAVRENIRRGASFIKTFVSGGVTSMGDKLESLQYSDEELRAIVDETERHGIYVTAHAHTDEGIRRAVNLGIHCIEHGTLVAPETAALAAEKGTYIVPTIAAISSLSLRGEELGIPPQALEKLAQVKEKAVENLRHLQEAGVKVGFGTDLLGELETDQCTELAIRRAVFTPVEISDRAPRSTAKSWG